MPYQPTEKDNPLPPVNRAALVTQLTWKDYLTIAGVIVGLITGGWKGMSYLFYSATQAAIFTTQVQAHNTTVKQSFEVLIGDYKGLKRRVGRLSGRVIQLEIQNAVLRERSKAGTASPPPIMVTTHPPLMVPLRDKQPEDKSLDLPILRKKQ